MVGSLSTVLVFCNLYVPTRAALISVVACNQPSRAGAGKISETLCVTPAFHVFSWILIVLVTFVAGGMAVDTLYATPELVGSHRVHIFVLARGLAATVAATDGCQARRSIANNISGA